MTANKTEPRDYRNDWIGEREPLATRYGDVSIAPLGWGIRVETLRERDVEQAPLRINGTDVRLSSADFFLHSDGIWRLGVEGVDRFASGGAFNALSAKKASGYGFDDATPSALDKLREELPGLVNEWAAEHGEAIERAADAYQSNRARTCEESIRELEDALEEYRHRLAQIEAGDAEVSPYLNGGRRLMVDD